MRSTLLQRTRDTLGRAGFFVTADTRLRPLSFDLLARRDNELLLVKVLTNVDSLSESVAREVTVLANFLRASPLLVGERSSSRPLEAGVVYARHGIPIMTVETVEEHLLEGVPPLVFAAPGGFYVTIDGARLRRLREEHGHSLGQLAEVAGVSRRAISMYEQGMSAMVEVAQRLEAFLDEPLVEPVDPFAFDGKKKEIVVDLDTLREGVEREVFRVLGDMGFRMAPVEKGPFRGVGAAREGGATAADDGVMLTGVTERALDLARSAAVVAEFCSVTETFGAFFVAKRETTRISIEGVPLIGVDEAARLDDPARVFDLISERRRRAR